MDKKAPRRHRVQSEDTELENAYKKMTSGGRRSKRTRGLSSRVIAIIAIVATTLLLIVGIIAISAKLGSGSAGIVTLRRNLSIAGVDVSGMTQQDAVSAVRLATDRTYSGKTMVITVYDSVIELTPADSGAQLDVLSAVEAALAYGEDNPNADQMHEMDILPYLSLNEQAIRAKLDTLGDLYDTPLTQTSYEIVGEMPSLAPDAAEENDCQTLKIIKGTPEYALDLNALYLQVLDAYNANRFTVEGQFSYTDPNALDLDAIYEEYYIAPVDAIMDPKTFEITAEVCGYGFDLENAKALFINAAYGETVEIPFARIDPQVFSDDLSKLLYRDELASYTASSSSVSGRDTNLHLACKAINGVVLYPGDVFSYNETLGERTADKGYQPAASYLGNETVSTLGGGICQVSSALYYCTLVADLRIVERECHTFASSYVPLGMDATVNWGTIDFRFSNNTSYPIRIEASADGGDVTVSLIGTNEKDYYVVPEYEQISVKNYTTSYQVMTSDNAEGYSDGEIIVSPYTGYEVKTYRCKYDMETNKLIEREFEADSSYNKRDKVVCRIQDPEPSTEPPTEPPTEPATQPTTEPTAESATEPTTEPVTEPSTPIPGSGGGITEEQG